MFTQENDKVKTTENNHQLQSLDWSYKASEVNQVSYADEQNSERTKLYYSCERNILGSFKLLLTSQKIWFCLTKHSDNNKTK